MKRLSLLLACVIGLAFTAPALAVDVDAYIKRDRFEDIKLSPNGAATVPLEDRTVLVILRRSDNKMMSRVSGGKGTAIAGRPGAPLLF